MSTTTAEPEVSTTGRFEFPFRHLIIDNWAEPELVRAAEFEWPDTNWPFWHRYECGKLATKDPLRFPPACTELIRRLLCLRIGELMGLDDTFADWNCHGAGLHTSPPGASLGVHLDSDHHPLTGWQRACNAILFVNSEWELDWGGEFELGSADGRECLKRIMPKFNRLVLFEPSDISFHAVARNTGPEPRKTLATFYWRKSTVHGHRSRAEFMNGAR
ncbi:2OG-Fe(II) oxygenase [Thalassoglobus sp.]|uniref:2OG-Fe(II) oxygenase n=1 Tax=Thalassoglobus sp. TaxID=2795869 RepID=UPI003AA8AAC9